MADLLVWFLGRPGGWFCGLVLAVRRLERIMELFLRLRFVPLFFLFVFITCFLHCVHLPLYLWRALGRQQGGQGLGEGGVEGDNKLTTTSTLRKNQ